MKTDNVFFNLCHPILDKLSDGIVLKQGFRIFFYVVGVLSLLGGILLGYQPLSVDVNVWSIILLLATTFTGWIIFQICWYRARTIKAVQDSEFVVSAIFAIFIRSIGEIAATILVITGFITGLVALFSDAGGYTDDAGAVFIVVGPIMGFLAIALFYFIAERLSALPTIAVNMSKDKVSVAPKAVSSNSDLLDN
jgi:hypothetical protein